MHHKKMLIIFWSIQYHQVCRITYEYAHYSTAPQKIPLYLSDSYLYKGLTLFLKKLGEIMDGFPFWQCQCVGWLFCQPSRRIAEGAVLGDSVVNRGLMWAYSAVSQGRQLNKSTFLYLKVVQIKMPRTLTLPPEVTMAPVFMTLKTSK